MAVIVIATSPCSPQLSSHSLRRPPLITPSIFCFQVKAKGNVFLTTNRIIFLGNKKGEVCEMKLIDIRNEKFNQPLFGANNISGTLEVVRRCARHSVWACHCIMGAPSSLPNPHVNPSPPLSLSLSLSRPPLRPRSRPRPRPLCAAPNSSEVETDVQQRWDRDFLTHIQPVDRGGT